MTDILTRLRDATEGSRELDAEVWLDVVPGATRRQSGYLHEATGKWCKIDETRDASGTLITVPRHTTSLDAKLPGEDIVMVSEQTTGRWCALQRGAKEAGYAQTEAMARRVACLKARMAKEDAA